MIILDNYYKIIDGCETLCSPFELVKKIWDWFDYKDDSNMNINFVNAWMFTDVWDVVVHDKRGLMFTFDNDNYDKVIGCKFDKNRSGGITKQIKAEIMKTFILDYLGGKEVNNSGVIRYFLEGYDIKEFWKAWKYLVRGVNYMDYTVYIKDKLTFVELRNEYFLSLGFDDSWEYSGVYDKERKIIKFTSWNKSGNNKEENKIVNICGGKILVDGVWMSKFEGTKEEFETFCRLML